MARLVRRARSSGQGCSSTSTTTAGPTPIGLADVNEYLREITGPDSPPRTSVPGPGPSPRPSALGPLDPPEVRARGEGGGQGRSSRRSLPTSATRRRCVARRTCARVCSRRSRPECCTTSWSTTPTPPPGSPHLAERRTQALLGRPKHARAQIERNRCARPVERFGVLGMGTQLQDGASPPMEAGRR